MFVGNNIQLTPIQRSFLPAITKWIYDPNIFLNTFFRDPFPLTLEQLEEWFQNLGRDPNSRVFALQTLKDNHFIGEVALREIDWKNRSAQYAILIGESEYRGKGYGIETTKLVLEYAFSELALHRIEARVLDDNYRAARCFENSNFRKEGTLYESVWRKSKWYNIIVYSILASQWNKGIELQASV
ncbi:MAG: GNAT family N-acetyltransferase [Pseudanabaenales cyanobacterium]|nr:GNAT family N-acetyltransferase [Pseudanabaenales cyanobacterium]